MCGCALSVVYGSMHVLEGVCIRDDCSGIARSKVLVHHTHPYATVW